MAGSNRPCFILVGTALSAELVDMDADQRTGEIARSARIKVVPDGADAVVEVFVPPNLVGAMQQPTRLSRVAYTVSVFLNKAQGQTVMYAGPVTAADVSDLAQLAGVSGASPTPDDARELVESALGAVAVNGEQPASA